MVDSVFYIGLFLGFLIGWAVMNTEKRLGLTITIERKSDE